MLIQHSVRRMPNFQRAGFEADLDPVTGAEQKGTRPVLVVSNEEFNQAMPNVTVLPLTSTKRQLYPSEILLPEGKAGQFLESIVMAHQIRTISKQRLGKFLGFLEDTQLQHEIQKAIKDHLDME
jgi:mRNA interferase MazF